MLTNRFTAAGDIPDTGIPAAMAANMTMAEQYEWHQAYLRRHPVSRRNFLRGSAAVAAVAALGVSPFGRRAYAQDAPLAVANRRVGLDLHPHCQCWVTRPNSIHQHAVELVASAGSGV